MKDMYDKEKVDEVLEEIKGWVSEEKYSELEKSLSTTTTNYINYPKLIMGQLTNFEINCDDLAPKQKKQLETLVKIHKEKICKEKVVDVYVHAKEIIYKFVDVNLPTIGREEIRISNKLDALRPVIKPKPYLNIDILKEFQKNYLILSQGEEFEKQFKGFFTTIGYEY